MCMQRLGDTPGALWLSVSVNWPSASYSSIALFRPQLRGHPFRRRSYGPLVAELRARRTPFCSVSASYPFFFFFFFKSINVRCESIQPPCTFAHLGTRGLLIGRREGGRDDSGCIAPMWDLLLYLHVMCFNILSGYGSSQCRVLSRELVLAYINSRLQYQTSMLGACCEFKCGGCRARRVSACALLVVKDTFSRRA
jgi:hypothetical protein